MIEPTKCKHQWNALAYECCLCGKDLQDYIKEIEAKLEAAELESHLLKVGIANWKHCAELNEQLKLKAEATIKETRMDLAKVRDEIELLVEGLNL